MNPVAAVVRRVGHAALQDLGRPGLAHLGITANGAADAYAARTANVLVGNADGAALIEITASPLEIVARRPLLVAVTGAAAGRVALGGHAERAWSTLVVRPGDSVTVASPAVGLRSYLAINGVVDGQRVYGSVAPDPLLGVGRLFDSGDEIRIDSRFTGPPDADPFTNLFDLGARPVSISERLAVDVTRGPDESRMADGSAWLGETYTVDPQSDTVGLRLSGPPIALRAGPEILSRGVPVGAVEVTPTGGLLVLLRARLLTAGYPVIAVVTTAALDRLGQARPGSTVDFELTDAARAREILRAREAELDRLAARVARAFRASGFGAVLDPAHRGGTS